MKLHYLRQHGYSAPQPELCIPSLMLEISYDDLEDTHYTKRFDILFSLDSSNPYLKAEEAKEKEAFTGSLDFKPHIEGKWLSLI